MGSGVVPNDGQPHDDELSSEEQLALESMIHSASNYVVPSDKLRGQVLNAARELFSDRRSERVYLEWVWVLAIVACLLVPVLQSVSAYGNSFQGPSAKQIEEQAIQLAREQNMEMDWGLVEVFSRMRQGSIAPSSR